MTSDPKDRAGAVLTIDLDAIAANWRLIQARLAPGGGAVAVVKADGYGLGAVPVAQRLKEAGCRRFMVATIDEGLALRSRMPEQPIMILSGPFPGTGEDFLRFGLIPVLNGPEQADIWAALARRHERPLPSVLHVDTGMSRLGFSADEARRLAGDKDMTAALAPLMVMSHLATADQPDHPMNAAQRDAFWTVKALFPGVEGSLAASSGIFLGQEFHSDWVRPGAALYGVQPLPGPVNPMAQVVRLQGRIIQVRDVDDGMCVGYGATHRVTGRRRLATVGAGYADGLFRSLSNRGHAILGDVPVPLVGRVSMDLAIFDVTDAPAGLARAGNFIDLIGPGHSLDDLAREAGTIGYEVLTALGRRYHRLYLGTAP